MARVSKELWEIQGIKIPVKIYKERRYNNRISITRNGVNLRVPSFGAGVMKHSYKSWAMSWLEDQIRKKPEVVAQFRPYKYVTGYEIKTPCRNYILQIEQSSRSTSSGKLRNHILDLKLSSELPDPEFAKTVRTLSGRLIGKDQLERVTTRIKEINDQCFGHTVNAIRIKNNSTNWGSCSHAGNINISVKTLLAPFEIQDYIFVHELAHRYEMNHSPRYWAIVEKVLPSYKKYEHWLKKYGHTCEI